MSNTIYVTICRLGGQMETPLVTAFSTLEAARKSWVLSYCRYVLGTVGFREISQSETTVILWNENHTSYKEVGSIIALPVHNLPEHL